jgi:GNAT superfamily N-acetyltransferase
LDDADHIMRLALGTYLGLPEPSAFLGDASFVHPRWLVDAESAFGAQREGQLVGSSFGTRWGSVASIGPLTVHPDLWNRGIASRLLEPVLERVESWGARHTGIFTYPQSQKHVSLYQKFGFWPRFLSAVMTTDLDSAPADTTWTALSDLSAIDQERCLDRCRDLTGSVYEGLDVTHEMQVVSREGLGETVLVWQGEELVGAAICHAGRRTQGGTGVAYVRFGAVRTGRDAAAQFDRLLEGCMDFARRKELSRLVAGVSTACHGAYQHMLAKGFQISFLGVTMHRPNDAGYHRPDVYVMDDWR